MRRIIRLIVILPILMIAAQTEAFELYRVVGEDCRGGRPAVFQTGFSFAEGAEIVTALHGVSGCAKISAQHFVGQTRESTIRDLSITKVDVERDLAVLSASSLSALVHDMSNTSVSGEKFRITGFPQGSSAPDTIGVQLGEPAIRSLRSILRAKDILRYEQIGSPSPTVNIVRLDGNAQIGHSGAPLTNAEGVVIGIVIGGYELGEFGTFWAIPISEITWTSATASMLDRVSTLRGQFSTTVEAPLAIASLELVCGSAIADDELSLSLSSKESAQIAKFAATLEENKDRLIYAQVSISQDGCMACDCPRESERLDLLSGDEFPDFDFGWIEFDGPLSISASEAPLVPTLWREGYRLNTFVPEFAVTTTFALPLPRHLENSQYRFQSDRAVRLGFDGLFVVREHFQTGWQMFHLEPTEAPQVLRERLTCIRDHLASGNGEQAAGWC